VISLIDGSMYWLLTNPAQVQVTQQTSVSEEVRYLQGAFVAKTNRLVVISDQQLFEFEPNIQRLVKTWPLSRTLGTGSPELAVSPKGDRIVAVGRSTARVPQLMLFDLEGKLLDLYSYTGREGSSPLLSYSSDGSILAAAYQKEITFFQMLAPGMGEKLVPDSNVVLAPSVVTAIAAHPHQGQFILGFEDGSIGLLSIEDKKLALFKGIVDQAVRSVAIDAERRQVYVGYQNGVLGVFALPAN
jgi:WD40 repeat protein